MYQSSYTNYLPQKWKHFKRTCARLMWCGHGRGHSLVKKVHCEKQRRGVGPQRTGTQTNFDSHTTKKNTRVSRVSTSVRNEHGWLRHRQQFDQLFAFHFFTCRLVSADESFIFFLFFCFCFVFVFLWGSICDHSLSIFRSCQFCSRANFLFRFIHHLAPHLISFSEKNYFSLLWTAWFHVINFVVDYNLKIFLLLRGLLGWKMVGLNTDVHINPNCALFSPNSFSLVLNE